MARLKPYDARIEEKKELYLGKVLLFCEGYSEVNYFEYLANHVNNKYAEIEVMCENTKGGSANAVLLFAEDFLSNGENAANYLYHEKCLIFDCDAPDNIDEVIKKMVNAKENAIYKLYPTNYLFETWLLMHYIDLDVCDKFKTYKTTNTLSDYIGYEYQKNNIGITSAIIGNGDRIKKAIANAVTLREKYEMQGMDFIHNIKEMNPFTTVDKQVKKILANVSLD